MLGNLSRCVSEFRRILWARQGRNLNLQACCPQCSGITMHADKPCCARWQNVPKPHGHRIAEEVCSHMFSQCVCVCVRINGLCRQASLVACTSRASWATRARFGPPGRGGAAFFPEPVSQQLCCCRTRARTRGGRKEQASRALPTALGAVSELAATVSSQAGNTSACVLHSLCQVALQREQLAWQREQAASSSSSGQARMQSVGVRQWLCILCCLTDWANSIQYTRRW